MCLEFLWGCQPGIYVQSARFTIRTPVKLSFTLHKWANQCCGCWCNCILWPLTHSLSQLTNPQFVYETQPLICKSHLSSQSLVLNKGLADLLKYRDNFVYCLLLSLGPQLKLWHLHDVTLLQGSASCWCQLTLGTRQSSRLCVLPAAHSHFFTYCSYNWVLWLCWLSVNSRNKS